MYKTNLRYEPRREKTGLLPMRKQRHSNCEADQHLCFRYTESIISPLRILKISRFWLSSVTVQVDLCRTWSEIKLLVMGKPTIYIGENKDADQLRGNREADQRLCFRYSDSTIPLLLKSEISSF